MITLDEVARRAAIDASATAESFDVDAGLSRLHRTASSVERGPATVGLTPAQPAGRRRARRWTGRVAVGLAAAAVVFVVAVAVFVSGVGDRSKAPADSTPPDLSGAPLPSDPPSTTGAPATSEPGSSALTTLEPTTLPAPEGGALVSGAVLAAATDVAPVVLEPFDLPRGSTAVVRGDGVLVSLDDSTRTVTVHESPPRSFVLDPMIGHPVYLAVAGPDGVVYAAAAVAGTDATDELFAVSTSADSPGAVVARSTGPIDGSGDTDLAAGPTGVVGVACCGPSPRHPLADAPNVLDWVDHNGAPILERQPEVWIEFAQSDERPIANLAIAIVRRDGEHEERWPIERPSSVRGMPPAVPTDDGGVLVALDADPFAGVEGRLLRGGPNGWLHEATLDLFPVAVEPSGAAIVSTVDGQFARIRPFRGGPAAWPGDAVVDIDAGSISAPGLNELIDATSPAWAAAPLGVALMIDPPGVDAGSSATYAEAVDEQGRPVVVVVHAGLLDDSVEAVRHALVFERGSDGLYRFVGGDWANRCQPNRGHQDFRAELCV